MEKIFNTICPSDVKVIDVNRSNWKKFISNILKCERTISSSLYGIIVSHAYNIKCMWMQITDKIGGGNFKFHDYYGSLYIDSYEEIKPYQLKEKISTEEIIKLINEYPKSYIFL